MKYIPVFLLTTAAAFAQTSGIAGIAGTAFASIQKKSFAKGRIEPANLKVPLANPNFLVSVAGPLQLENASFAGLPINVMRPAMAAAPEFSDDLGEIRVPSCRTWRELLQIVDQRDRSIAVVPSNLDQTIGETMDGNLHGRNPGIGQIFRIMSAAGVFGPNGVYIFTRRESLGRDFLSKIPGHYGSDLVLNEVVLTLIRNERVERVTEMMPADKYPGFFKAHVLDKSGHSASKRADAEAMPSLPLHEAVLYAPGYDVVRAVSWRATDRPLTLASRLPAWTPTNHYRSWWVDVLGWCVTHLPGGSYFRRFVADPLYYMNNPVASLNYAQASGPGYVMDLDPASHPNFVSQEYYVPADRFEAFRNKMAAVLTKHHVSALNVSVQYSPADHESTMPWARDDVFIFVITYNKSPDAALWSGELINAAGELGGSFDLGSQTRFASAEQIVRAYPATTEFLASKFSFDTGYRFHNLLLEKLCPMGLYVKQHRWRKTASEGEQRRWEAYRALNAEVSAIGLYNYGWFRSIADIHTRRDLLKRLMAANDILLKSATDMGDEAKIAADLRAIGLPDYLAKAFARMYRVTDKDYTEYHVKMRQDDQRIGSAVEVMLNVAERQWGHWHIWTADGTPTFDSPAAGDVYNDAQLEMKEVRQEEDALTRPYVAKHPE